ncbi:MAG: transcriptional repressor [Chryseobacterium sp.]|nr:MAG: transcriptional repressor [Chryseobacterium sp.]
MNTDRIHQLLYERKVGITPIRAQVLDLLMSNARSYSLSEIEDEFPDADRSTLYRTLKTFEKERLVHSVQENQSTKYLYCEEDCGDGLCHHNFHLHFHCKNCDKTVCIEEVSLNPDSIPEGFSLAGLTFAASGICRECSDAAD